MIENDNVKKDVKKGSGIESSDLARDSVGIWRIIAEGLMSNAPMSTFAVVFGAVAVYSLGASPIAFLIGAVVVWVWVNTPYQFSKKMQSASGVQYFVHNGIGPRIGFVSGLSYYMYYLAIISSNALAYAIVIQYVFSTFGISLPVLAWIPLTILVLIPGFAINYFGVKTSLNYGIITAILELTVITILSIAIIIAVGPGNTLAVYNPQLGNGGLVGFAIGMLTASYTMSGTTSTVYLGYEAKAPQRTIKRGLVIATLLIVFVFILFSYALTVGWGLKTITGIGVAPAPGIQEVLKYFGPVPEAIIAIMAVNSFFGLSVASMIICSRIGYTFGKQGFFPAFMKDIHHKYHTPRLSLIVVFGLGMVCAFIMAAILGDFNAYIWLILEATIAEFIGHIIADVSLASYYSKQKTMDIIKHGIIPSASMIVILFGIFYTFYPVSYPIIFAPVFTIIVLFLGGLWATVVIRKKGVNAVNSGIQSVASYSGIQSDVVIEDSEQT